MVCNYLMIENIKISVFEIRFNPIELNEVLNIFN